MNLNEWIELEKKQWAIYCEWKKKVIALGASTFVGNRDFCKAYMDRYGQKPLLVGEIQVMETVIYEPPIPCAEWCP